METYTMTKEQIQSYAESLRMEEHSESTVQKYANALGLERIRASRKSGF